jgi:porin
MFQTYYQFNVTDGVFFQPALTYIPTPGANPNDSNSLALTFRLTMLF